MLISPGGDLKRRVLRWGAVLLLSAGLSGCALFSKTVKATQDPTLNKILDAAGLPPEVQAKISMYRKYAAKFMKFHDSANLDEADVLDVLHDTGVISQAPGTRPPGSRPAKPSGGHRAPAPVPQYGGAYQWPTDAGVVSSEFGGRWGKEHKGMDIAAKTGEPLKASAAGVVIYSDNKMRGYGNVLIVRHDERVTTLYAHCSKLIARAGDKVAQGQVIGLLGSTGHSTGPHVHFELRDGETAVNPRERLGPSPY